MNLGIEPEAREGQVVASEDLSRLRREIWQEFSDSQVELLISLRDEISSRRWKIMLEIDAVRGYMSGLEVMVEDPDVKKVLAEISNRLTQVHRELSRIPEDVIPPF